MKNITYSKINLLLTIFLLNVSAVLFVPIHHTDASITVLQPDASGRIYIDIPTLVDIGNTLSIPAGATVEFRNNGSLFVKGQLDIGMTGSGSDSSQNAIDLLRGTRIISTGYAVPISLQGGMLTAFNINFYGEKFVNAFQNASVLISSSTFETTKNTAMMSVYQGSRLDISSSVIKNRYLEGQSPESDYGSALLEIYANSNATMTAMKIDSPRSGSGILIYNSSKMRIDDTDFSNCRTGITAFRLTEVRGTGNTFSCNIAPHLVYLSSTIELLARQNICCARVIFVPGLQGSRLYRKESNLWFAGIPLENQLWEPDSSRDIGKLFLDSTGKSILSGIYTRDIIDRINIFGKHQGSELDGLSPSIYGNFITYLDKLKSENIIDGHKTFPYDWRLPLQGLRDNELVAEIVGQAAQASNEKVILIAHSYGGLVVKDALSTLEAEGKSHMVQSVIYVAVPETGAPQAIFAGLHGDKQSILQGFIMDPASAIKLAANMPSAHLVTPSDYFSKPIVLDFFNRKTGSTTRYEDMQSNSTTTSNRYSMTNVYAWIKAQMHNADAAEGQQNESPIVRKLPGPPSTVVGNTANTAKETLYTYSAVLENAFRTYSIIGIDLPTPIGMLYRYLPCIPPLRRSFSDFGPLSPCLNDSALTRTISYSKYGDGTVIFDGKDRRSGTDSIISLASMNLRNNTSISHVNIMESPDVQHRITTMITATSSPQTDPFYDSASGTGSNPANPWINTNKVFGLDISGFVEGMVQATIQITDSQVSASSSSIAPLQIVTLDHAQKIQEISGPADALAVTTYVNTNDGWSFGSVGTYDTISLRSLKDQSISISFSEHTESASDTTSGDINIGSGNIATSITDSFSDVDVGFGSIMNIDMQYVSETPARILSLDIDGDGMGDMTIHPDKIDVDSNSSSDGQGSTGGSVALHTPQTYTEKQTAALNSIAEARISISQLEIYSLRQTTATMLTQMERYLRSGNPTLALLALKKKQARLAEISTQYALRIKVLERGLLEGILRGFRFPPERAKKDAEILKIRAYIRDLALLKIILKDVERKAIDLLI